MTWTLPVMTCANCASELSVGEAPPVVCAQCGHQEEMTQEMWSSFAEVERELVRVGEEAQRAIDEVLSKRYDGDAAEARDALMAAAAAGRSVPCPQCWSPGVEAPVAPSFVDCESCQGELRGALGMVILNSSVEKLRMRKWRAGAEALVDDVGPPPAPVEEPSADEAGALPASSPDPWDAGGVPKSSAVAPSVPPPTPSAPPPAPNQAPEPARPDYLPPTPEPVQRASMAFESPEHEAPPEPPDEERGTSLLMGVGLLILVTSCTATSAAVALWGWSAVSRSGPTVQSEIPEDAPARWGNPTLHKVGRGDQPSQVFVAPLGEGGALAAVTNVAGGLATFAGGPDGLGAAQVLRSGGTTFAAGDLDRDGDVDLVGVGGGRVVLYRNDGAGRFRLPEIHTVSGDAKAVVLSDMDADGVRDIVTVGPPGLTLYVHKGGRAVGSSNTVRVGKQPHALGVGDLDGEGGLDVVIAGQGDSLDLIINNGSGTFEQRTLKLSGRADDVLLAQLDGDPVAEIVVTGPGARVSVFISPLEGLSRSIDTCLARRVASGDLDGDGSVDLVVACPDESLVEVLFNDGEGGFRPGGRYGIGGTPTDVAIGDIDGDGRVELLVSDRAQHGVVVLHPL